MQIIQIFQLASQICLYVLLVSMELFALLVFGWQIMIFRGKAMVNPDGSLDDWHEQKSHRNPGRAGIYPVDSYPLRHWLPFMRSHKE